MGECIVTSESFTFHKLYVLGLGYIGLPTHGLEVVGVDIDQEVVEMLNNGDAQPPNL
jgi:UDP-N-acetyl-D-mannosaminuronate dehydrogenase